MKRGVERSAARVYRGVWRVLADWFRVPQHPPAIPTAQGDFQATFHPSRKYLAYLKMYFWVALVVIDLAILAGWIVLLLANPVAAAILAVPAFVVAVVPDVIAYVAIHLRYDTLWYAMTDRSLRARRGIWVIAEHTITFENVQDVFLRRGPIQQLFGIANVIVETAGSSNSEKEDPFSVGNRAVIEGIDNPDEIRDLILERVRATRTAGLGDERRSGHAAGWSPRDIELLREIRDEAVAIAGRDAS